MNLFKKEDDDLYFLFEVSLAYVTAADGVEPPLDPHENLSGVVNLGLGAAGHSVEELQLHTENFRGDFFPKTQE